MYSTGKQFPFHVGLLPTADSKTFIPCQIIVSHVEPKSTFQAKSVVLKKGVHPLLVKPVQAESKSPKHEIPSSSSHEIHLVPGSIAEKPETAPGSSGIAIARRSSRAAPSEAFHSAEILTEKVITAKPDIVEAKLDIVEDTEETLEAVKQKIPYFIVVIAVLSTEVFGLSVDSERESLLRKRFRATRGGLDSKDI